METLKNNFTNLCTKYHTIGATIVIANEKKILDKYSYGLTNSTQETKTDTIYRIASISKTVGSIALMQLVQEQKIDLNEDISTYLGYKVRNPHFPNDIITIKMLTLQTSSILDGYDDENPAYDDIKKGYNGINGTNIDVSLEDLLTNTNSIYYTDKTFGNYKPGTRWNYSNFGCGIMACIIEKVSQEYYVDYMEKHIFKPLNLDASFKASHIKNQDKIANMYAYTSKGLKEYPKENFINSTLPRFPLGNNYRGPAGGLFISMEDLSIIMRLLMNYGTYNNVEILKREYVETMYQMQWIGTSNDTYRAKGIQMKILNTLPNFPLRGHTGGAYGVRSYMFFSLKYKIGACFITNGINSNTESSDCQNIFLETQKLFINEYAHLRQSRCFVQKKEILLEERKILNDDLFFGKFINAMNFSDMMNTVGLYQEDLLQITFTINNITKTITDVILYKDNLYIDFEKTLDLFKIQYQKDNDNYQIYYL